MVNALAVAVTKKLLLCSSILRAWIDLQRYVVVISLTNGAY